MSILADLFIFITQSTLTVFTVRVFQKIHLTSLCFLWISKQWGSNQVSVGSTYFSHGRNHVIKKWLVPKQFSSAPIRVQFCPRTYYKIRLWWPLCAELCNCTIIAMWAKQTSENLLFCPAEPVCVTFPIEAYFFRIKHDYARFRIGSVFNSVTCCKAPTCCFNFCCPLLKGGLTANSSLTDTM